MPDARNLAAALLGARVHLTLSSSGMVLQHAVTGWQREPETIARIRWDDDPAGEPERLAMSCAPFFAKRRFSGLPLKVTLSEEHVRLFMVTPPANARHPRDLQGAAAARFHTLYGDASADWRIAFEGNATRRFVACALPRVRIEAVRHVAKVFGLCLTSVAPLFIDVWNRAQPWLDGAWMGLLEGQVMTLVALSTGDGGGIRSLHRQALPAQGGDIAWLRQQVVRFALREGVPVPAQMQLYRRRDLATVEPGGRLRFLSGVEQPAESEPPAGARRPLPQLGRRSKPPASDT
jgi:hypothetical protein